MSVAIVFGVLPFMGMLAKPTAGWIGTQTGPKNLSDLGARWRPLNSF